MYVFVTRDKNVQYAFKNSMIHEEVQFTLSIASHYVLHRNGNQGIPCKTLTANPQEKQAQRPIFLSPQLVKFLSLLTK